MNYPTISQIIKDNKWLGEVVSTTNIGPYTFVEYSISRKDPAGHENNHWTWYYKGRCSNCEALSLEEAMVAAVAHTHLGPNNSVGRYVMMMIEHPKYIKKLID